MTVEELALKHIAERSGDSLGSPVNALYEGYLAGYAEATRWRDPKVELPDYYQKVDVKFKRGGVVDYASAALLVDDDGSYFFGDYHFDIVIDFDRVIGWRPIE